MSIPSQVFNTTHTQNVTIIKEDDGKDQGISLFVPIHCLGNVSCKYLLSSVCKTVLEWDGVQYCSK